MLHIIPKVSREQFDAVMAAAPRNGLPKLTANGLAAMEHARARFEALVGLCDSPKVSAAERLTDRTTHPLLADCQCIDDEALAVFVVTHSGATYGDVAVFLYEEFVELIAAGVVAGDAPPDMVAQIIQDSYEMTLSQQSPSFH